MITELARISELVEKYPTRKLQTLVHYINEETIILAHREMDKKKAVGVDKVTKEDYDANLETNVKELIMRMKNQAYIPQPVRRVYIEKDGSKEMRPLGILAYEDKLVQKVISEILNRIYEPEFKEFSYGFRPGRNCHQALKELNRIIEHKKVNYVVDADIKGFFNNVDHEWMIKFLEHKIQDNNLIRLIKRFLKAGVMEDEMLIETDRGTPQGGNISPILANLYLHYVLDLWFEQKIKKQCKGEAYIVRYADDFVCCFQHKWEAERFYKELRERLSKFGLELAEDKSKIIPFGRFAEDRAKMTKSKIGVIDFLGFTHYCGKSKAGKFRLKRKTSKKKFKVKLKKAKAWLKKKMHSPIAEIIKELNLKLIGHYRYYGISDNYKAITSFGRIITKMLFKTLRRRSQRDKITWEKFKEKILNVYPIARPRIYVNLYEPEYEQITIQTIK